MTAMDHRAFLGALKLDAVCLYAEVSSLKMRIGKKKIVYVSHAAVVGVTLPSEFNIYASTLTKSHGLSATSVSPGKSVPFPTRGAS